MSADVKQLGAGTEVLKGSQEQIFLIHLIEADGRSR